MGIKPGPKKIADSTGKPDRRRRDNKSTPGNNRISIRRGIRWLGAVERDSIFRK